MITTGSLISTSVSDAKSSMDNLLLSDPRHAAQLATSLLERLHGAEGQAQRRQLAARTLRKAAKAIAEDTTPDPEGPRAGDMFAELGLKDLRTLLIRLVEKNPIGLIRDALATLVSLRAEQGAKTRRQALVTAIGHAAKELQS